MEVSFYMKINLTTAQKLIEQHFPQWKHLPITEVSPQGHDHRSFRLGSNRLMRIPSHSTYQLQVQKEKDLLPRLQKHLSIEIPKPLHFIEADEHFMFPWAIYQWIEGDVVKLENIDGFDLADQLATILIDLRNAPIDPRWMAGPHNFHRGAHLFIYHQDVMDVLSMLSNPDDYLKIWKTAIDKPYTQKPVFVHGDIAINNLLVLNRKLVALIDFGSSGMGDPACDYVIAWTFFSSKERVHFRSLLNIDDAMWQRAKGWALWKALISLKNPNQKDWAQNTLNQLLEDEKKV